MKKYIVVSNGEDGDINVTDHDRETAQEVLQACECCGYFCALVHGRVLSKALAPGDETTVESKPSKNDAKFFLFYLNKDEEFCQQEFDLFTTAIDHLVTLGDGLVYVLLAGKLVDRD